MNQNASLWLAFILVRDAGLQQRRNLEGLGVYDENPAKSPDVLQLVAGL